MKTRRHLNAGLGAVLVLLVIVAGYSLHSIEKLVTAYDGVADAQVVRTLVRGTQTALTEAESNERAYIATGDTTYVAEFRHALVALDSHVVALEDAKIDSANQHAAVISTVRMKVERVGLVT